MGLLVHLCLLLVICPAPASSWWLKWLSFSSQTPSFAVSDEFSGGS